MGRAAWLLMAWLPLVGCDETGTLSLPTSVPTSTDAGTSASPTDEPSAPKDYEPPTTDHSSTRPTDAPWSGSSTTETEERADPLADALDLCANEGIDAEAFAAGYAARVCEEWVACVGGDCLASDGEEYHEVESFDAEAACACLESAWSCETSYGAGTREAWTVIPDPSCFQVY